MAERPTMRRSLPPAALALILLTFTVAGLAAGTGTRALVDRLGAGNSGALSAGNPASAATHTRAQQSTASPSLEPSATTSAEATGFTLSAAVSPSEVTTGGQFSVTVVVIASDHVSRLSGVPCTLTGTASLTTEQPPIKRSNANGVVTWSLRTVSGAHGIFTLQVEGTGYHAYYYFVTVTVDVSS